MLGFHISSASKFACIATVAALMLSASAPASLAASPQQHRPQAREHVTVDPQARARYQDAFPSTDDPSDACVGGYRLEQRLFGSDQPDEDTQLPLRCR